MRGLALFIAVVGCSAGPVAQVPARQPPPTATPSPDAPPPSPAPGLRGARCEVPAPGCAAGLECLALPGGYCASTCGGAACEGTCVDTGRAGELCLARCTRDGDCRADEGYVCDPTWHACTIPNLAAIVPKQCPLAGPALDKTFAASEPWSTGLGPSAIVTDDGGVIARYASGDGIGESRLDGAGHATLDVAVHRDREHSAEPWLARERAGKLYAASYDFDAGEAHGEIAMATSTDRGATWSNPIPVHDPDDCKDATACLGKPRVAIGPDPKQKTRDLVYVMYGRDDTGLRVRTSRDRGTTFGRAVTALAGSYGSAAIGDDGRLHLATLNGGPLGGYGSAQQKIEYTVSADGGATFAKAIAVSGRDELLPFYFANPSIAVDDRRKWLYVAYVRGGRDARWDVVIAATKDAGKTWTRTRIGDDCAIHMVPNLALDPTTGTLHVAWYDSDGAVGRFAHATCAPGAAKCTPQGAINTVPFAALSTGSRSVGAYESLVVDDKRRVLHAVWTQAVADGDKIVSRIFHAQAKLPRR